MPNGKMNPSTGTFTVVRDPKPDFRPRHAQPSPKTDFCLPLESGSKNSDENKFLALEREMIEGFRPVAENAIAQKYDEMFQDAKTFLGSLITFLKDKSFELKYDAKSPSVWFTFSKKLDFISASLSAHPQLPPGQKLDSAKKTFNDFAGHWKGYWQDENKVRKMQDHYWEVTRNAFTFPKPNIGPEVQRTGVEVQRVVMGPDEGAEDQVQIYGRDLHCNNPVCVITTTSPRFQQYAINAVDENGKILGYVCQKYKKKRRGNF